jgi:hypothetical protein
MWLPHQVIAESNSQGTLKTEKVIDFTKTEKSQNPCLDLLHRSVFVPENLRFP